MGHILLSDLTPSARKQLTGQTFRLPKAKGASDPYYYDGQGDYSPVPDGTPISVWSFVQAAGAPEYSGYWIARTANPHTWAKPCVFRTRRGVVIKAQPTSGPNKDLTQVANALVRVGKSLERLCEVAELMRHTLEGFDNRISYLAAQVEFLRKDNHA